MKILKVFIFLGVLIYSCTEFGITENKENSGFNIYLLKDSTILANTIFDSNIKDLLLADKPFITYKDLDYYKWNTHSFCIDSTKIDKIKKRLDKNIPLQGIPFVIMVNEEKIYTGAFWNPASSVYPVLPHIDIFYSTFKKPLIFTINRASSNISIDMRKDDRIYNCLKKEQLLIE